MPTRSVCVVAITGSPGSVEFVDPHSFGAETILIKPVAPERLLEAVARCFDDTALLARLAWNDPIIDEDATS
jgi:DNA-binding NtrC family response regulator